jgi:hypothetical protein
MFLHTETLVYDDTMTFIVAGITSEDSIIVASDSRRVTTDVRTGEKFTVDTYEKFYSLADNVLILVAGVGISILDNFGTYLSRILALKDGEDTEVFAESIGKAFSNYWYSETGEDIYFDIIIAIYADKPCLYLWEQKTRNGKVFTKLSNWTNQKSVYAGDYKEGASDIDKLYQYSPLPAESDLIEVFKNSMIQVNRSHPDSVGGKVNFLRMTRSGTQELSAIDLVL